MTVEACGAERAASLLTDTPAARCVLPALHDGHHIGEHGFVRWRRMTLALDLHPDGVWRATPAGPVADPPPPSPSAMFADLGRAFRDAFAAGVESNRPPEDWRPPDVLHPALQHPAMWYRVNTPKEDR